MRSGRFPLSREEFADADFQETYRYERAQGRLVVISPAGPDHRRVSRPFRRELGGYWASHPELVEDVDVEGWVATSDDDDRLSDMCVYLFGTGDDEIPYRVPELIFEFVSRGRANEDRDYIEKRVEYHTIGVKEYVIVDRVKSQVLVLNWQADGYAERVLTRNEIYTSTLLPGLAICLTDVFDE